MKKITLLTFILSAFSLSSYAQEGMTTQDYNKFSIDLGLGVAKASTPVSENIPFYTVMEDLAFELGARYMLNDKFGFKVSGLYFESTNAAVNGPERNTEIFRANLEGVANLGNLLGFREFTQRFNLLFHAGAGITNIGLPANAAAANQSETNLNFMGGITPQIKLSDRFAINVDLSVIGTLDQNLTLDGFNNGQTQNFDGMIATATAGLSIYFGDHERHADWVDNSPKKLFGDRVAELENELAQIQRDLQDTDKDGVADYLDREPNTTSGVAVNTKGESIDRNQNGIPDELEQSLEKMYVTKEYAEETYYAAGVEGVKPDANDDLINVYFRFDSTQPEYYSLDAINQIVKYMRAHPDAEAVLTGYADQIGNTEYNRKLSEDRAKKVYDIVIATGIDASRLSYKGGGVDSSVDKDSEEARQIVRRVSFELK
ncbi:OmpA family protein [Psychroflexus sediminis]|uniref:OmpA-OmpF porin, OOP family n=1 Tax=Psychroflexus sediminis TaxID=470826 RepID=A0A1G7Z2U3_9FLAO|nr:OmpA family protein [Psychroflexus sediminis]SDH03023.1 OmpA-OmpF porin, OOP family [Psychroflexus sediminis]